MSISRRSLLVGGTALAGAAALPLGQLAGQPAPASSHPAPAAPPPAPGGAFSFDQVKELARLAAAKPLQAPPTELPGALADISYDGYRKLRFRPDRAIWADGGLFRLQLFHRGFLYRQQVAINLVENGKATPLAYDPALFDMGDVKLDKPLPPDFGFAGFRIHHPLNRPDYFDEFAVFLGASYFRLVGRNQIYGLSARGLAVDTAGPKGEEYPFFRAFWIERPAPDAAEIAITALLDSQSVTGAYRFTIRPGGNTVAEVESVLFPRRKIDKLGIAPLTSMFLHGENTPRPADDFRPEVHDSDGLLVETKSGEMIWRPLVNPRDLRVASFVDDGVRGFGLMQRDRSFASYQDMESLYHRRPGLWVEPLGEWGPGRVELIEIPAKEEIHDNMVALWVPKDPPPEGKPVEFRYRLHATSKPVVRAYAGWVVATRLGAANLSAARQDQPTDRLFVVDFAGGDLDDLLPSQPVVAKVGASSGQVAETRVEYIPDLKVWRASFRLDPDGRKPSDLRCFLSLYGQALSETWTYLWTA